jgi:hypothetical protein
MKIYVGVRKRKSLNITGLDNICRQSEGQTLLSLCVLRVSLTQNVRKLSEQKARTISVLLYTTCTVE